MSYAKQFERKLCRALKGTTSKKYCWFTGHPLDRHSIVDVAGLIDGIPSVLVEVELKKDNPVENVVKIWGWARSTKPISTARLFHAFSAHYFNDANRKTPKLKQFERAVFVGDRMSKDREVSVRYDFLPIYSTTRAGKRVPFTPRMRRGFITKRGGSSMLRAAEDLASSIAKLLRAHGRQ
jgi:hypothetical protein